MITSRDWVASGSGLFQSAVPEFTCRDWVKSGMTSFKLLRIPSKFKTAHPECK